mmetsp:Transcript_3593/g.7432  ORF Transcript_3593/g.7432 Transcript_3593/m.7432 type:complete len:80 (+) Transcript_3593:360-599(+)
MRLAKDLTGGEETRDCYAAPSLLSRGLLLAVGSGEQTLKVQDGAAAAHAVVAAVKKKTPSPVSPSHPESLTRPLLPQEI